MKMKDKLEKSYSKVRKLEEDLLKKGYKVRVQPEYVEGIPQFRIVAWKESRTKTKRRGK
jgi:DNA-binding Lrp family transcriptional regulator